MNPPVCYKWVHPYFTISLLDSQDVTANDKIMVSSQERETGQRYRHAVASPAVTGRPVSIQVLFAKKRRIPLRVSFSFCKSARRDSNPRPRPWQGRAPPTEPLAHYLLSCDLYMLSKQKRKVNDFFNFFAGIGMKEFKSVGNKSNSPGIRCLCAVFFVPYDRVPYM